MKDFFLWTSSILAVTLFIPFYIGILKKKIVQNALTSSFLATLNAIFAIGAVLSKGNYYLSATYVILGLLVVGCIIYAQKKIKWSKIETFISILCLLAIGFLLFGSNKVSLWASIIALTLAYVPQIVDTYKNPKETPILIYLGFTVANTLSIFVGKDFSIAEVGYGIDMAVGTLIISLVAISRRKLR